MKSLTLLHHFSKKYIGTLIITIISMISLVLIQLLIPWIIRTLVTAVTATELSTGTMDLISKLTIIGIIALLGKGFLQFLRSYMAHLAGWGVVSDARKFVYHHLQRLSLRFYANRQTGQLMSRVINDTDLFERLIAHAIPDIFVNILTFIGVTIMLVSINGKLTLFAMLPIPLVILSLILFAKVVRPAFRKRQGKLGELNAVLSDNISGIREIKAFTREEEQYLRVEDKIENYRVSNLEALKLMAIFQPFMDFTSSLGQMVIIFFGGRMALQGTLPVADLVAFFLYLELFYNPIRSLGMAWEQIQEAMAGFDRIAELLDVSTEIKDTPQSIVLSKRVRGDLQFNQVSFTYNDDENVLENINVHIPANHVAALVGPTGVGKTTLASLIPRFYDVSSGEILLDGMDIRDIKLESLRQQISMVLQDVFLFHGTLRENILFGNPKSTHQQVIEAAKIANVHEFITSLPDGYDTLIGERGIRLSGGQRQRVSIARAVLKDTPILILDEATSSVDVETEFLIQQALDRLMQGRTTIVIAHRLSTIRKANQIIVLEGKNIREIGSHDELIAQNGLYKRLYSVQEML